MGETLNRRSFFGAALGLGLAGIAGLAPKSKAYGVTSAEKKAEIQVVKANLDAMTSQLEQTVSQYNAAQDAYEAAVASVAECQARIDEATANIATLQDRLTTRAKAMYREGATSYMDVLMGSNTFDDFSSTYDMLKELNADDAELVINAKQAKAELEAAKEELDANEQAAKDELASQETLKASIEAQEAAYQAQYESLSDEYQQLLAEEEAAEAARQAAAAAAYTPTVTGTVADEGDSAAVDEGPSGSSSDDSEGSSGSASGIPTHGSVVDYAESRLGCPYVWGASGPNAFDCSGLTMWCYAQIGISLGHYDGAQYSQARVRLAPEDAAPGDVLWRSGHVAISTGGTNYIHAPHTGDVVRHASGGNWVCALRF